MVFLWALACWYHPLTLGSKPLGTSRVEYIVPSSSPTKVCKASKFWLMYLSTWLSALRLRSTPMADTWSAPASNNLRVSSFHAAIQLVFALAICNKCALTLCVTRLRTKLSTRIPKIIKLTAKTNANTKPIFSLVPIKSPYVILPLFAILDKEVNYTTNAIFRLLIFWKIWIIK